MTREERDRARDEAAQERGDWPPPGVGWHLLRPGRYIHATHPDHGEAVSFVPGELLPAWVVEQLEAQQAQPDADGVYHLRAATVTPKGRRRPPKERT